MLDKLNNFGKQKKKIQVLIITFIAEEFKQSANDLWLNWKMSKYKNLNRLKKVSNRSACTARLFLAQKLNLNNLI